MSLGQRQSILIVPRRRVRSGGFYLMSISFNNTVSSVARRAKALFMLIVACAISIFVIVLSKVSTNVQVLPYDPTILFLLSFIVGTMLTAVSVSIIMDQSKGLAIISSVVSMTVIWVCAFLLEASPTITLLCLSAIPVGITVALCFLGECEKAHTVTATATVFAIALISAFLIDHYASYGEISTASFTHFFDTVKQSFISAFSEINYEALGLSLSDLSESFDALIPVLPSVVVIIVSIVAYISVSLARSILLGQGALSESLERWPLKMSRMASIVFLIAFLIISLSDSKGASLTVTSALNIMLILTPGFLLIGIRSSVIHLKRSGFFGMIFIAMILFTSLRVPSFLVIIIATLGALDNLFPSFRASLYGEDLKKQN